MSKSYVDATALQYFKNKLVNIMPTVNNGTLTILRNGLAVGTFSANQSSSSTVNISVPNVTNPTVSGTTLVLGNTVDTGNYSTKTEVANSYVSKEKRYIIRSETNTINVDCSNFINYSMSFLTTCVWSADTTSISYNGNVLFEFPLATVINMAVYKDSTNMIVYYNGNKYEITVVDNNYTLVLTRNRGGTVSINVVTP